MPNEILFLALTVMKIAFKHFKGLFRQLQRNTGVICSRGILLINNEFTLITSVGASMRDTDVTQHQKFT